MPAYLAPMNFGLYGNWNAWGANYAPLNEDGFIPFVDPSPSHVCRFPTVAGQAIFFVDLGYFYPNLDTVALINTSLKGSDNSIQVGFGGMSPNINYPTNILTSASLNPIVLDADRNPNSQIVFPVQNFISGWSIRYVTFIITTPMPFVDVGIPFIGRSIELGYYNMQNSLGIVDTGTREINQQTGAAFDFKGKKLRTRTVTFGHLNSIYRGVIEGIDNKGGVNEDVLFIHNNDLPAGDISCEAIYGNAQQAAEANTTQVFHGVWSRTIRFQERG